MGYLKGKSALMLFDKHPQMGGKWNREFWARGYYVATVGEVNEEAVKKYIAKQVEDSYQEDRTIK
jgi:putative transposase